MAHKVTVKGADTFEVEPGTKLVKAIENNGIDISHRCGGLARCTTCRVRFSTPEPEMGRFEKDCLEEDEELGNFRLSCQIKVDRDMEVDVLMRASEQGWDPGPEVED